MSSQAENYRILQEKVNIIRLERSIAHPVRLIAVSKTFPATDISNLYQKTGQDAFGENYAQELSAKAVALNQYPLEWHFIGRIQSNKIKLIASHAAWVHSLTNGKHALLLNNSRDISQSKLNVLIEVNISNDPHKHGVHTFNDILELAKIIKKQPKLHLRGLMGMSGINTSTSIKNQQFAHLNQLFNQLKLSGFEKIDTLSMGMSDDFETALKNGSTMLRVGSLIFGPRHNSPPK